MTLFASKHMLLMTSLSNFKCIYLDVLTCHRYVLCAPCSSDTVESENNLEMESNGALVAEKQRNHVVTKLETDLATPTILNDDDNSATIGHMKILKLWPCTTSSTLQFCTL